MDCTSTAQELKNETYYFYTLYVVFYRILCLHGEKMVENKINLRSSKSISYNIPTLLDEPENDKNGELSQPLYLPSGSIYRVHHYFTMSLWPEMTSIIFSTTKNAILLTSNQFIWWWSPLQMEEKKESATNHVHEEISLSLSLSLSCLC